MATLFEALLGGGRDTVERVRPLAGDDPQRAEQAYGAAVGTVLRGMDAKTQTKQGAESLWDFLRKQVEQGNIPAEAPAPGRGVQVRDLDPQVADDMLKVIFGKDAPKVEGGFGKVITLDSETSRKVFAKVLPAVLGAVFGAAEQDAEASPQALPKILAGTRKDIEEHHPKSASVFEAILDQDHDGDVDLQDLVGIFAGK